MRDGWSDKSNYLLFDCGPHGALNCGHAHADALSIQVAANGHTVLVDPGTYTYTGSKELRDWFRSAQAHNTVTLNGQSHSVPDGAFTWKSIAECRLLDWVTADNYDSISAETAGIRRTIFFQKRKYWIVRDTNNSPAEHTLDIHFHFDSGTNPCLKDGLIHEPQCGLTIRGLGSGHWIEENQWVSHCYGQKEPAKVFRFSAVLKPGESVYTFLLL